jgi:hypothetical protein
VNETLSLEKGAVGVEEKVDNKSNAGADEERLIEEIPQEGEPVTEQATTETKQEDTEESKSSTEVPAEESSTDDKLVQTEVGRDNAADSPKRDKKEDGKAKATSSAVSGELKQHDASVKMTVKSAVASGSSSDAPEKRFCSGTEKSKDQASESKPSKSEEPLQMDGIVQTKEPSTSGESNKGSVPRSEKMEKVSTIQEKLSEDKVNSALMEVESSDGTPRVAHALENTPVDQRETESSVADKGSTREVSLGKEATDGVVESESSTAGSSRGERTGMTPETVTVEGSLSSPKDAAVRPEEKVGADGDSKDLEHPEPQTGKNFRGAGC